VFEQPECVLGLQVLAQDNDADRRIELADPVGDLDAFVGMIGRHANVGDNGIRMERLNGREEAVAIVAERNDLEVRDGAEQLSHAFPHEQMVVGQRDSQHHPASIGAGCPRTDVVVAPSRDGVAGAYLRAMAVRVLIVDDLEPFRGAARLIIEATPGFEVAGEVGSGEASLETARAIKPDLVLMDINLPGIDGVEAGRRIVADAPSTVVVLVSTRDGDDVGSIVADSGAAAYLAKARLSPESLRTVWLAATEGE